MWVQVVVVVVVPKCWNAFVCDEMEKEEHLTYICDLSLSPQKDEVITLQPFVLLSLSRRASIELIGEDSPRHCCCCFVITGRRQIYSDISLLLSMNSKLLVCYFGGGSEKPLHPHHLRFPFQCESPSAWTNEGKQGSAMFTAAKFISSVDWVQSGIIS